MLMERLMMAMMAALPHILSCIHHKRVVADGHGDTGAHAAAVVAATMLTRAQPHGARDADEKLSDGGVIAGGGGGEGRW